MYWVTHPYGRWPKKDYRLQDRLFFPHHYGETVFSIIVCDPEYITMLLEEQAEAFQLDDVAQAMYDTFLRIPKEEFLR